MGFGFESHQPSQVLQFFKTPMWWKIQISLFHDDSHLYRVMRYRAE